MKKPWVLSYPLSTQGRLIRLGGCAGWSESSLAAQVILLVCCKLAHIYFSGLKMIFQFTNKSDIKRLLKGSPYVEFDPISSWSLPFIYFPYLYGYGVIAYLHPFAFKRGLLLPLTFPERWTVRIFQSFDRVRLRAANIRACTDHSTMASLKIYQEYKSKKKKYILSKCFPLFSCAKNK